jgi:AcrR family transcriptional regulator
MTTPPPPIVQGGRSRTLRLNDRQILDAARTCVLAAGVHNTTLNDVARRAGVSRLTLYRRYSDIGSLISEVLGHEFARVLREHTTPAPGAPPDDRIARQRLVDTVIEVVEAFHADPLFQQVIVVEPEILTPYLFNHFGSTQQIAVSLLANRLDSGHRDGSIRTGSVAVQAHTIVLTAQSFIVSGPASGQVPLIRLMAELRLILDGYLRPQIDSVVGAALAGAAVVGAPVVVRPTATGDAPTTEPGFSLAPDPGGPARSHTE